MTDDTTPDGEPFRTDGDARDGPAPDAHRSVEVVDEPVVELEFTVPGEDSLLVALAEGSDCTLTLESVAPRSDGSVLEILSIRGDDARDLLESVDASPKIHNVRALSLTEDEALIEVVSESAIATALADQEALFTEITVTGEAGRILAEVPGTLDVSAVLDGLRDMYPGMELLARRETDRQAPTLTETQFAALLTERLTDRQLEAIRAAHARGYFEWPRGATAEEVAETLGISTPTFTEHLRAAERKLLDEIFGD